ncbi:sigma-70 family RNA polymerase sigma factor [Mesobacillus subterraneus]|uniref:sigma-70 family RNA polymerase sigma factor n=1 Tax=Mesobacillus subterraneus TaxID=285983 RepID=UPI00203B3551|nr:sigma-70 family RNA polymerase sigma factor [Mesobacillus subterraneus]MCM3664705.1 sigma-70 family RNA polymerase sigma factor [Mesobacillus subterraneus]MCM3683781.1 sigma-70 family RNA polymerase sigma factor [Mesobacillus subterraneus]
MHKQKAIADLMDHYGTAVLQLAYSYVRDRQTAEDLAQEIFFKCYQKYDTFQGNAQIQTWLFRVASNHCKDYLKSWHHKKVFVSNYLSSFLTNHQSSPENELIKSAENQELTEALFKLPVKYREILFLFYFQECSLKEISEISGLNLNTVKSRLSRAKTLLKEILQERSGEDGETNEGVKGETIKGRIG